MDLSRMKAEKDARDGQDLAMARQRQSEQVRQNILMREQTQRVATIPVRNILLWISLMLMVHRLAQRSNRNKAHLKPSLNRRSRYNSRLLHSSNFSSNILKSHNCIKYKPNNKPSRVSDQMAPLRQYQIVLQGCLQL